jgi:hypothetical protein
MTDYATFDANGVYTAIKTSLATAEELASIPGVYVGRVDPHTQYHDHSRGVPVDLPPQPSAHHVFNFVSKKWLDPRTTDMQWALIRTQRDRLLAACDWTQLGDVSAKPAWVAYRQVLRDITQQSDPFSIVWPVAPA